MHVFLDTNVLLSLYKLSGMDLEELKKIVKLAEASQLSVHVNSHVCDEFLRNREKVIKDSLDRFTAGKGSQAVPNLLMPYPKTDNLRKLLGTAADLVKEIREQADEDARLNKLEADKLVDALFKLSKPAKVSIDVVRDAQDRQAVGNPPGKRDSLGDAINWEWLLATFPEGNDLHIVSADGDYESDLHASQISQFLMREWSARKKSQLHLHKSLPLFLKATFPHIKLADEIDKALWVEKLEKSWSYSITHNVIEALDKFSDFSDDHLLRLLAACNENGQVYRILNDEDVRPFAEKLLAQAKSPMLAEEAAKLKARLDAIDQQSAALAKLFSDPNDDDIPF